MTKHLLDARDKEERIEIQDLDGVPEKDVFHRRTNIKKKFKKIMVFMNKTW